MKFNKCTAAVCVETGVEQGDRQHDMHFIKLCSYKLKLK